MIPKKHRKSSNLSFCHWGKWPYFPHIGKLGFPNLKNLENSGWTLNFTFLLLKIIHAFLQNWKNFKNGPPLKIYFSKWPSFVSGSPLAATTTATTSSTPFSTSTSNILDRLSLPPYKPNHLPQKAEELLKTLVNPIGKRMKLRFSLYILQSVPFFQILNCQTNFCIRKISQNPDPFLISIVQKMWLHWKE